MIIFEFSQFFQTKKLQHFPPQIRSIVSQLFQKIFCRKFFYRLNVAQTVRNFYVPKLFIPYLPFNKQQKSTKIGLDQLQLYHHQVTAQISTVDSLIAAVTAEKRVIDYLCNFICCCFSGFKFTKIVELHHLAPLSLATCGTNNNTIVN